MSTVHAVSCRVRRTSSGAALPRVDGRLRTSRRFKQLVELFTAELGDAAVISEPDQVLIKTAAGLTLRIEQLQADIVAGRPVDDHELIRISSEGRRVMSTLRAKAVKAKPAPLTMRERLMGGGA